MNYRDISFGKKILPVIDSLFKNKNLQDSKWKNFLLM